MTTRRAFIFSAIAGSVLAAHGPASSQARTIGAIRVDASRIAAQGWGERSVEIKRALERAYDAGHAAAAGEPLPCNAAPIEPADAEECMARR